MRRRLWILLLALAVTIAGFGFVNVVETEAENVTIDEDVLSIKMQKNTNADGTVNLRIVSSVEHLDYANAGFEIYFSTTAGTKIDTSSTPIPYTTTTGMKRISAHNSGVEYNYSPKVVDAKSEYFVSATMINIAEKNFGNYFYIRPFVTLENGTTKEYGVGRYFTLNSATASDTINMPVKIESTVGASLGQEVTVKIAGETTTATVIDYVDGYAHLDIKVPAGATLAPEGLTKTANKANLPSASKVEVVVDDTTVGTAIYRNTVSSYANNGADTSWMTAYADDDAYTIITDADLYGFKSMVNDGTFDAKTVYAVADIEADDNNWVPIGTVEQPFVGTFDGQGHSISNVKQTTAETDAIGFFGYTSDATVKNFRLTNSFFSYTGESTEAGTMGSIASHAVSSTFEQLYSEATLTNAGSGAGGIIGETTGDVTVSECWFAGGISLTDAEGKSGAGMIGSVADGSATVQHCLNAGTVSSAGSTEIAAFVGSVAEGVTDVTVKDCLNTATITATEVTEGVSAFVGSDLSDNVTLNNSYVSSASGLSKLYPETATVNTRNINFVSAEDMTGAKAFGNTTLQFRDYWTAVKEGTPVLTSLVSDEDVVSGEVHVAVHNEDYAYTADGFKVQFVSGENTVEGLVDAGNYITLMADPGTYDVKTEVFGLSQTLENALVVESNKAEYGLDLYKVFSDYADLTTGEVSYDFASSSATFSKKAEAHGVLKLATEITGPFSVTAKYQIDEQELFDQFGVSLCFGVRMVGLNADNTEFTDQANLYATSGGSISVRGSKVNNAWSYIRRNAIGDVNYTEVDGYTWNDETDYSKALIGDGLWIKYERTADGTMNVYLGVSEDEMFYAGSMAYKNTTVIKEIYLQFNHESADTKGYIASIENVKVSVTKDVQLNVTGFESAEGLQMSLKPEAGATLTRTVDANNQINLKAELGTYAVTANVFGVDKALGSLTITGDTTEYSVDASGLFTYNRAGEVTHDFKTNSVSYTTSTANCGTNNYVDYILATSLDGAFSVTAQFQVDEAEVLEAFKARKALTFGMFLKGKVENVDKTDSIAFNLNTDGTVSFRTGKWTSGSYTRSYSLGTIVDGEWEHNELSSALTGEGLWIKYERTAEGTVNFYAGTSKGELENAENIIYKATYTVTSEITSFITRFHPEKGPGFEAAIKNIEITVGE